MWEHSFDIIAYRCTLYIFPYLSKIEIWDFEEIIQILSDQQLKLIENFCDS
jgi:hypothetical protein